MIAAIDIETVPNEDLLANAPVAMPPPTAADAPKTYKKDEAIENWVANARAGHEEKVIKTMSLDPILGRILCIGLEVFDPINGARGTVVFGWPSDDGIDTDDRESSMLREFFTAVSAHEKILTWNGDRFDMPFIVRRAKMLDVSLPTIFEDYSEIHEDVMKATSTRSYTGGWNNKSLQEMRGWFGISQETDHDGSDVYKDFQAGNLRTINDHCADDVKATMDIAIRLGVV